LQGHLKVISDQPPLSFDTTQSTKVRALLINDKCVNKVDKHKISYKKQNIKSKTLTGKVKYNKININTSHRGCEVITTTTT